MCNEGLFTGIVKYTLEKMLCEVEIVDNPRDAVNVAMDFGRLTIDEDIILHLYATPGQERFNFIYPLLRKNALALIILGDITNEESIKDIVRYYRNFKSLKRLPTVVALTKTDLENRVPEEKINRYPSDLPKDIPVLKINATDKESVKQAVLLALQLFLEVEEEQEII